MTVPFLDLERRVAALRPELDEAIGAVLDGGRFVFGPSVEAFEDAFAEYCGVRFAVGVASGTDAITIALGAAGVGAGDDVIVPANTCVPTVVGVEAAGARPVLADVDPDTYTIAPDALEAALTPRTRALVSVHLYGQCADMDDLVAVARDRGLVVVEDAAQAHGAEYKGRRAGSLGDVAAFSFYPTKNLGALGDAGAVLTDDEEVAERARLLRNYGQRRSRESVLHGRNSRLDTLQAAVLLAALPRLDGWNERRRELAERYRRTLADVPLLLPCEGRGRRHVYHLFVVRAPARTAFRARLAEQGVETLVHYSKPIHAHPAYRGLDPGDGMLAASETVASEVVSLPLYPELRSEEVEALLAAVERACGDEQRDERRVHADNAHYEARRTSDGNASP